MIDSSFLNAGEVSGLSNTILVGDTAHDARAARDAGVLFYGVTFGYGTKVEMEEVGWQELYTSVEDLHAGLLAVT